MDLPELITIEIKYILNLIKKGQFILAKKKIDDLIKNNAPSAFLKNFEGFCYKDDRNNKKGQHEFIRHKVLQNNYFDNSGVISSVAPWRALMIQ